MCTNRFLVVACLEIAAEKTCETTLRSRMQAEKDEPLTGKLVVNCN